MYIADEAEDTTTPTQHLAAAARGLVDKLFGKAAAEADELAKAAGVILRVLHPGEETTTDYVDNRITAHVDESGKITRASVG